MTLETGSNRHPARRGSFEAVPVPTPTDPDAVVPGEFRNWRTLDQVRGAALAAAVDCARWLALDEPIDPGASVIALARTFESYLDPAKEADGPS